jgi:hypothetical protein
VKASQLSPEAGCFGHETTNLATGMRRQISRPIYELLILKAGALGGDFRSSQNSLLLAAANVRRKIEAKLGIFAT